MSYEIGENIIHPTHGPGLITDMEEHELNDGPQQYYVIEFEDKRLTVRVPVNNADDIGLRSVITANRSEKVMETLGQEPEVLPSDFKARQKQVEELIYSGRPVKIAEAVRELSWRRADRSSLGIADQRLLDQGRELLVNELALATDKDTTEVEDDINTALNAAIELKQEVIEAEAEEEEAKSSTAAK